jgi:hypothetical protein
MFEFLSPAQRPKTIVRVKATSGVNAKPWDGPVRGVAAGETVDCSELDAGDLIACGRGERVGKVGPNGELLPPEAPAVRKMAAPYVPKPYPELWADLPKVFRAYWDLSEEFSKLSDDYARLLRGKSGMTIGRAHVGELGTDRFAEQLIRAEDRVRSFNHQGLARAHFECGNLALSELRSANATAREVTRIGFEIFSLRVALMEMHISKVRYLYPGSAPFMKYNMPPLSEPVLRSTGSGTPPYIDGTIDAVAEVLLRGRRYREEGEQKLALAKAELEAATAAPAAPATPRKATKA